MKQKPQPKSKQAESQSEHSEEFTVAKLHGQTTNQKNCTSYLVEFKGMPSKEEWMWKTEQQLANVAGFKKELRKYSKQQEKSKDHQTGNTSIVEEKQEIEQAKTTTVKQTTSLGEYAVNKEQLYEKIKKAISQKPNPQQYSLETFLKPLVKPQSSSQSQQLRPQPTLPTKLLQPQKALSPASTRLQQPSSTQWIQKIKAIKSIKGYELKNGELSYEVDVWDKNGQTFFVPPLNSQTVKKIDQVKLALFLQETLVQGWRDAKILGMDRD